MNVFKTVRSICSRKHWLPVVALCCVSNTNAQKIAKPQPPIFFAQGKLSYTPDSLGNRIPDFSWCGYKGGAVPIPTPIVSVNVRAGNGDATDQIQSAIDYVSRLPIGADGFRGVVLLEKGTFNIKGTLRLKASGVVLRGMGFGNDGTTIIGAGTDRATLITIEGHDNQTRATALSITNTYVPVNATSIDVANAGSFKIGDDIIITRPSTKNWIDRIGTEHFGGGITSLGWKPGQRVIEWRRKITAINGNKLSFDVPLTNSLDTTYGVATISTFTWPGRIFNCGVENMNLVSSFDPTNNKDEDHRWMAITIDRSIDCWVRRVTFQHFAGSAVAVYAAASQTTIEDCQSLSPVSEIGGERRNTFFTGGQQTLFQRCYAQYGIHDFATGFCAPGPNAFVQCESYRPYSFSGGIDSWSSGVLFDVVNVDGNAISFMNRGQDGQGAGWNIANSVLWNCSAARIDCYQPPTAQNWALGSWSQFAGDGYWGESNNTIEPRSLYYAQLKERLANSLADRIQVMNVETDASSSPSVETAAALAKLSNTPSATLRYFIEEVTRRQPIETINQAPFLDQLKLPIAVNINKTASIRLLNGWLVQENRLLTGKVMNVPWWNGSARPYAAKNAGSAITRFVPGKVGKGLTDDLNAVTDSMLAGNAIAIEHNYGLWYDRRRDDHERIRRMDGEVWAPFYELPFARSGKDTAWDGLSKYDLTKFNHWYWNRLKSFADLADEKGLLLIHQNYFQHNIIEAGAHYADFPWRPVNNINSTDFPEPVPYAGDKRIFMAEQFYDTAHPVRRALHIGYIRQCLDNFRNNRSVIQLIGEEYTGPLHFVQFWLNTIRNWQLENGKKNLVGLSTTRDVQDAILADPGFASLVDVIDIKYWHYQADEKVYAPIGGQSLAPRQHARLLKPRSSSLQQVYRAVLEYKLRFPEKAVIYSADGWDKFGLAVLMAGGSLPNTRIKDAAFLTAASSMKPVKSENANQWILTDGKDAFILYSFNEPAIQVDEIKNGGRYAIQWINTDTGETKIDKQTLSPGKRTMLTKPGGSWVVRIYRI